MKARNLFLPAYVVLSAFSLVSAQNGPSSRQDLFRDLQEANTSDRATHELLLRAKHDEQIMAFLKAELPPMIDKGPKGVSPQWTNAVHLAGKLRVAEAAPALGKWISIDSVGDTSIAQFMRLDTNPAGKALSQIGDPAVPTLTDVLTRGTTRERRNAYLVLNAIGSPRAQAVLRDYAAHEQDAELRDFAASLERKEAPSSRK